MCTGQGKLIFVHFADADMAEALFKEADMAGVGPPPKQGAIRRNKRPEPTKLVRTETLTGPELPEGVLPDDAQWHKVTRTWWENWRRSPQASRMLSDPDWDFLLDTALMHHVMWSKGRWEFAAEIRLRVAKFGATVEDRLRLKAEISTPEPMKAGSTPAGTVTDLDARRQRLLGT